MTRTEVSAACPIMPSRDLGQTEAFYAPLGFVRRSQYPRYLILMSGNVELHFFEADEKHDPSTSDHGVYLRCTDPVAFAGRYVASASSRLHSPEVKPWGMLEGAIVDPDGNLLRFGVST